MTPSSFCSTGAPHSTIKYKSYGIPHPSVEKKKPSEVVQEKLHPQASYKDGLIRPKPNIIEHHSFFDKNYLFIKVR
ncbi:hypothetical protein CY35_20G001100 [Sphagnum magellanicum]|nr:hypothetical protein CY35_20G001100 [Sphagnum magellanicum]